MQTLQPHPDPLDPNWRFSVIPGICVRERPGVVLTPAMCQNRGDHRLRVAGVDAPVCVCSVVSPFLRPVDCGPSGPSVLGILQAGGLE